MTSNTEADPSAVASDPATICFCDHGKRKPNCSYHNRVYSTHAFPGQDFPVRLAVVGQGIHGVVPGAVRAYFDSSYNATLGLTQNSQASKKPCCVDKCECDPRLDRDSVECFINDQSFLCQANSWIGFINESSTTPGVMFHPYCPIGYVLLTL